MFSCFCVSLFVHLTKFLQFSSTKFLKYIVILLKASCDQNECSHKINVLGNLTEKFGCLVSCSAEYGTNHGLGRVGDGIRICKFSSLDDE